MRTLTSAPVHGDHDCRRRSGRLPARRRADARRTDAGAARATTHHRYNPQLPMQLSEPIGMRRVDRVYRKVAALLAVGLLATGMAACGSGDKGSGTTPKDDGKITLGFAQVGAESA